MCCSELQRTPCGGLLITDAKFVPVMPFTATAANCGNQLLLSSAGASLLPPLPLTALLCVLLVLAGIDHMPGHLRAPGRQSK
jgi:hypothetical protein